MEVTWDGKLPQGRGMGASTPPDARRLQGHAGVSQGGTTGQLRRAASVPANIAEGCGRNSDAELAQFLVIPLGPITELDYHLVLAHDLGYLPTPDYDRLAAETEEGSKMLAAFSDNVRRSKSS